MDGSQLAERLEITLDNLLTPQIFCVYVVNIGLLHLQDVFMYKIYSISIKKVTLLYNYHDIECSIMRLPGILLKTICIPN